MLKFVQYGNWQGQNKVHGVKTTNNRKEDLKHLSYLEVNRFNSSHLTILNVTSNCLVASEYIW
jgi:hypothetical protein